MLSEILSTTFGIGIPCRCVETVEQMDLPGHQLTEEFYFVRNVALFTDLLEDTFLRFHNFFWNLYNHYVFILFSNFFLT